MFRKIATSAVMGLTLATAVTAAPADAQRWGDRGYGYGRYDGGYGRYDRGYGRASYNRGYYGHRGYGRGYRGGRCYDPGNGGLAIGAVAGGLAGNMIAGYGDRTLGTVIGAVGGGLLGRSIDRSDGARC